MLRLFLIVFYLLLSSNLQAVQRYQTNMSNSSWDVLSSPIQCEMVHNINHYGNARFVFSSGGELAFQLHALEAARREGVASLYSVAPFWRESRKRELAQLTVSKGDMPVYVGGNLAYRMLYELQEGRHPTFHYKDWAGFEDDVYVSVSSVNFHRKLDEFKLCISNALPYGSDQVKDAVVHFDSNKSGLSRNQRKKLSEIIMFAKMDEEMKIDLLGHADARGRRIFNRKLSARRARAVEKYLVSKGIPTDQISQKALGETRPVASNRSLSGMKKNRRVEVIVKRE